MNKYKILVIVFSLIGSNFIRSDFSSCKEFMKQALCLKSNQAIFLSHLAAYFNIVNKNTATRYKKYVSFYASEKKSALDRETLIDLGLFPLVDYGIGLLFIPLKSTMYVRGISNNVLPSDINFLLDEAQLITSAAIVRTIKIGATTKKMVSQNDAKKFGKSCLMQVSCDAIDEAIISPVVKMTIGTDDTWSGWLAHAAATMGLAYLIVSN